MRALSSAIDRFCFKHRRFGIPNLMRGIVMLTALVYVLMFFMTSEGKAALYAMLAFIPTYILQGQVWRLVTWIFLPLNSFSGAGPFFTIIMLFFYYSIGTTVERAWGKGKFTIYYLFGVILHVVYGFIAFFIFGRVVEVIVYMVPIYLNMSLFFAYAIERPDNVIRLFFIIPIKMKWAALLNGAFFLYGSISSFLAGDYVIGFLPLIAMLNFLLICGDDLLSIVRRTRSNVAARHSPQVINFKKEAKRVKRNLDNAEYRHKCAVCGVTDTENPEMDFRYCSQCQGYHCFCTEHINNHIHFI